MTYKVEAVGAKRVCSKCGRDILKGENILTYKIYKVKHTRCVGCGRDLLVENAKQLKDIYYRLHHGNWKPFDLARLRRVRMPR